MVVSCPPCCVPVEQKTEPILMMRAPFIQMPPVWSRKLRIWAAMFPNRVGVPEDDGVGLGEDGPA